MRKTPYPSDMTDQEWEIVSRYIPKPIWYRNLQEPKHSRRDIVDAIFYRERTGCQWRNLPHDFPPWQTVFQYYWRWGKDGTLERLHDELRAQVRVLTPHADGTARTDAPTISIVDSQSAKTSEEGVEERGYDAGKKVKGRKRHISVDALGLMLTLHVSSASVQDRDAALALVKETKREFPSVTTVFMDGGYRGQIKSEIEKVTGVHVEISMRSDTQKKGSHHCQSVGSSNARSDG
jgi:putative transposase